jgi:hypothetical protein
MTRRARNAPPPAAAFAHAHSPADLQLAHRQFHCTMPASLVISPGAQFDSQLLETVETR